MIITLTRTGGFTGIPVKKTIDTSTLPPDEAKEIEEFLSNNPINEYTNKQINKTEKPNTLPNKPDQFTYSCSIQNQETVREIHISEAEMTSKMKSIFAYLMNF